RRLLFAILPEAHLTDGTLADPKANRGIEVFPKQDTIAADGFGNMVWLPWWHGAADSANQFYQLAEGNLTPFLPDDFTLVSAETLNAALSQIDHGPGKPGLNGKAHPSSSTRVPSATILACALAASNGRRNQAGFDLAVQLRDNGYS